MEFILAFSIAFLILLSLIWKRKKKKSEEARLLSILDQAQAKASSIIFEARAHVSKNMQELEAKKHEFKLEMERELNAHKSKEEKLEQSRLKLIQKTQELEKKEKLVAKKEADLDEAMTHVEALLHKRAELSCEEARHLVLKEAEKENVTYSLTLRQRAEKDAANEAAELIICALGRVSGACLQEASITEVSLPNEEMKAKIIGREGKNIKCFQQLTGVNIIVDDTPLQISLSCFDVTRREVAKIALQELIRDGRITASTIAEAVTLAKNSLPELLLQYGLEAANRAKVFRLDPEILRALGNMHFRSTLGQNLLEHSIEVAELAAMIASELKVDSQKARRMGLLHDIGKVLDLEKGPTHAIAGYRFCREHHESEEIANGIGAHHNEMASQTLEAEILKCADYLSGARRGARADSTANFFQRLQDLEQEALKFEGVESAFALSSGRELQVFVKPDIISDIQASLLAKEIAQKIQSLSITGKVQVTLIREIKKIEYTA